MSNSPSVRVSNPALATRLGVPIGSVVRVARHNLPIGTEAVGRDGSRIVVRGVAFDFLEQPDALVRMLTASDARTPDTVGRLVESVGAQLPEADVAAEIRSVVAAEEQRQIEIEAAAQATRYTNYPPEVLAAGEALGMPPKEIVDVRRVGVDVRVRTFDGGEYVIVDSARPDGSGRSGVLSARRIGTSPIAVFTPRPTAVARGRARLAAKRTARVEKKSNALQSTPSDPLLEQLERDLAEAEADAERRPGAGPPLEAAAALRKVIESRKGQLANAYADAHPQPPAPDEIALRRAAYGWAVDTLAATSDAEVRAARGRWMAVHGDIISYQSHHARHELETCEVWFADHGISPDAA